MSDTSQPADMTVETADATTTVRTADHAVNDTGTVRMVIGFIGAVVLAIVVGEVVLVLRDRTLPPELLTLGSVGLGALGALLASTASRRS